MARTKTNVEALRASLGQPVEERWHEGVKWRDLNGNGRLDVYEDPRAAVDDRVDDLLAQMTVDEKVGLMFHPQIMVGRSGAVIEGRHPMMAAPSSELVIGRHIRHFNLLMAPASGLVAKWHNELQRLAERTRLGIPITFSSDPRHAAEFNPGAGMKQAGFSEWPSQLGLGAIGTEEAAEEFGATLRQEFAAIGLRTVLNPMADVATEPRWGRVGGTFGEDPELVGRLTAAYIRGAQSGADGLGAESVSCMVKHFAGCGPQEEGRDPHFSDGARQVYPGDRFDLHVDPFRDALAAGARQVMLSYGIPVGQTSEDVAMAFNREIVTDLLRGDLGFDGVVCSDWMTVDTVKVLGLLTPKPASCWGVEHLSIPQRVVKAIDAGVDQFGGESWAGLLAGLVERGDVGEDRIDDSVRRLLRVKFELGLFDDPFVDEGAAVRETGTVDLVDRGLGAQRRSLTLLTNTDVDGTPMLPVEGRRRLYVEGVDSGVAARFGEVVKKPEDADLAIIRRASPTHRKVSREFLSMFFPGGPLSFKKKQLAHILEICRTTPTVVDIRLDRPAVVSEIAAAAAALVVSFGSADEVLLDMIFGRSSPGGRLPVELPSSQAAVEAARTDVPCDTTDPLFPLGHGLRY